MADHIKVGEELFIISAQLSVIAAMYNEGLEKYGEGMAGFLDGDRGYLGKANKELTEYKDGVNGHLLNLVNYLQTSSQFVYKILEEFAAEDKKLAEAMKMIGGEK